MQRYCTCRHSKINMHTAFCVFKAILLHLFSVWTRPQTPTCLVVSPCWLIVKLNCIYCTVWACRVSPLLMVDPLALTHTSCTFCTPYLLQIFSFHCWDLCSLPFSNSSFTCIVLLWLLFSALHTYNSIVLEMIWYLCLLCLFIFTSVTLPSPTGKQNLTFFFSVWTVICVRQLPNQLVIQQSSSKRIINFSRNKTYHFNWSVYVWRRIHLLSLWSFW